MADQPDQNDSSSTNPDDSAGPRRVLPYETPESLLKDNGPVEVPRHALLIIFLIVFTDFMGFGIIIPALPFYIQDNQAHPIQVAMLFSAFSICQFIGSPILGAISDRVGRRPVLIISQLGSSAGYLLLALATPFQASNVALFLFMLYLARIIDGISGGNVSTAQAYISDVTTAENRSKGMGMIGAAFGIGFSAGPALGGVLGHWGVSLPAYVAAGFALGAAILTWAKLKESRRHMPSAQGHIFRPSVFMPVIRRPVLSVLLMISFCLMAAFVMMETSIGLYLNKLLSWDQKQVGYYFAYAGVIILVVQGRLIGPLTKVLGEWKLAVAGPLLVGMGMLLMVGLSHWPMVALLLCAGFFNATGRSLQMPTMSSLISRYSGTNEQGTVFGIFHGTMSIARVIGPLIAGLAYEWRPWAPFAVAGVIVTAMGVWTLWMSIRHRGDLVMAPPAVAVSTPASEAAAVAEETVVP